MTVITTANRAHGLLITRQGKAFYSREHINIHRFMEALPASVRQSLEAPRHVWAVMAGPFLQVVPEGREGGFKATIAYDTQNKKRLYDRVYPKCRVCGSRTCDKAKLGCK
ncbi:MAG: hypothetical protein ACRCXB_22835 [Aeromonadaceae bacterium]